MASVTGAEVKGSVIRIDEDQIRGHVEEVVRSSVEETLNHFINNGADSVFADRQAGFVSEPRVQVLAMPHCPEVAKPIVYTVALQLLSYHVAVQKGTDVDKPRNLAKSVTVE